MKEKFKICSSCGGGFPDTAEWFGQRGNICKECRRLATKHSRRIRDCRSTYERWRKLNTDFHNERFYAICCYISRIYKNMVKSCTDIKHWDYKFHGRDNVKCLFESYDIFADHMINDLKHNDPEKLNMDLRVSRIDLTRPLEKNNIRLVSQQDFYTINEIDSWNIPPVKTCPKCSEKYYATTEYFSPDTQTRDKLQSLCKACNRTKAIEYGQKKRHQKKKQGSIEGYLEKLYEKVRPCNPNFLFRSSGKMILLKFFGANPFIKYCMEILNSRDPRDLRLDLIDYDKHVEPGNLCFLTPQEYEAKHKGDNNNEQN